MNGQVSDDSRSLERKARRREEREAITLVLEVPGIRVILGSRISDDGSATAFIEVASHISEKLHTSYHEMMVVRQRLDGLLKDLGYSSFDDDLDLMWEMVTSEDRWAADLARVRRAVAHALEPDLPDPIGQ